MNDRTKPKSRATPGTGWSLWIRNQRQGEPIIGDFAKNSKKELNALRVNSYMAKPIKVRIVPVQEYKRLKKLDKK